LKVGQAKKREKDATKVRISRLVGEFTQQLQN
jgi:hypothetical protein